MEMSHLLTALAAYWGWGPWENGLRHQLALREGNVCDRGGKGAPMSFWNLQRGLGKKNLIEVLAVSLEENWLCSL